MKYILITGASSGIGRRTAVQLAKRFPLILSGTNAHRLEDTLANCSDRNHLIWNFDLENIDNIERNLEDFILKKNINVAGFVHSAGIEILSPIKVLRNEDVKKIMNVNFISAVIIMRTLLNKSTNGKNLSNVIFVSSIASRMGVPIDSIYAASKGALNSFMRASALELAPSVRVNSVLPGNIRTGMFKALTGNDSEVVDALEKQYPLGIGEPKDVACIIEFLLSDAARWITGQEFVVDGGRTLF